MVFTCRRCWLRVISGNWEALQFPAIKRKLSHRLDERLSPWCDARFAFEAASALHNGDCPFS